MVLDRLGDPVERTHCIEDLVLGSHHGSLYLLLAVVPNVASVSLTRGGTALETCSITETTYTSYAQQGLAAATWGAAAERPTNLGRQMTYPQVTFPTVGASGATINGFYITDNAATKCIGQANHDDLTATVLLTNDVYKLTPTLAYLH